MNEFIKIIEKINGGSLFEEEGYIIEKDLFSDKVRLFIDGFDNKYYFFGEYICDGKKDNWNQIQNATVYNESLGNDKPKPSDSYLILFWKVSEIDDSVYSKVIALEENEFFYKKYVLYYTQEEYDELQHWLADKKILGSKEVFESLATERDEISLSARLLLRIVTKMPFWKLEFPVAEFEDFERMINLKIAKMRDVSKDEVQKMKEFIDKNSGVVDNLADAIFSEYLKEWC